MMKRILSLALLFALLLNSVPAAFAADTVPVTGIKTAGKTKLTVGETVKWTASAAPENATDKSLWWAAGNPGVATVDSYGNITAHKPGQCHITVKAKNGVKKTLTVTVVGDKYSGKTYTDLSNRELQYKANLFLNNFAEDYFYAFNADTATLDRYVMFAYSYLKLNKYNSEFFTKSYGGETYYSFSRKSFDRVTETFFGRSFTERQLMQFQIQEGLGRSFYQDGYFYFTPADGVLILELAVVESIRHLSGNIFEMKYRIYESVDDELPIDDKSIYYMSISQANASPYLRYNRTGFAKVRLADTSIGEKYQLLTYSG